MGALYHKLQTQSSAPEDGRNHRPKQVELIGVVNKPLFLHLVGCLYYCICDALSKKHKKAIRGVQICVTSLHVLHAVYRSISIIEPTSLLPCETVALTDLCQIRIMFGLVAMEKLVDSVHWRDCTALLRRNETISYCEQQ